MSKKNSKVISLDNESNKKKDVKPKVIIFDEKITKKYPEFKPNLTPKQIFELGSFHDQGGYFRPIPSKFFDYKIIKNHHKEHLKPGNCLHNVKEEYLITPNNTSDKNRNKYKVKAGSSLEYWEKKEWIIEQDPYGWVQWYCRFYDGRRSPDDDRQIKRWIKFAGEIKGRWNKNLMNKIIKADTTFDDYTISPIIRQSLQHWAYQLTKKDFDKFVKTKK